jgi:hypothetical protein
MEFFNSTGYSRSGKKSYIFAKKYIDFIFVVDIDTI